MRVRSFDSPAAFHAALEARVRAVAAERGRPMNRVRTLLVMERFLARVMSALPETTMLKGGLALELRLERARSTRDIDLRLVGDPAKAEQSLVTAASLVPDPDDFLRFSLRANPDQPTLEGDGVVYEGFRFDVTATLAGRQYADPFGLDVAYADVVHGSPAHVTGSATLAFVGIAPVVARVYPVGTHIAEKLHAYTLPRRLPNSRLKDLPDIALLAGLGGLDAHDLREAIDKTFAFRGTHPVPLALPEPPPEWTPRYARMAREEGLMWPTLDEVLGAARAFLEPVLRGVKGVWDPGQLRWVERPEAP